MFPSLVRKWKRKNLVEENCTLLTIHTDSTKSHDLQMTRYKITSGSSYIYVCVRRDQGTVESKSNVLIYIRCYSLFERLISHCSAINHIIIQSIISISISVIFQSPNAFQKTKTLM